LARVVLAANVLPATADLAPTVMLHLKMELNHFLELSQHLAVEKAGFMPVALAVMVVLVVVAADRPVLVD
jgi:hypothetical protein